MTDVLTRFAEILRNEARIADELAATATYEGAEEKAARNTGAAKRLREIADNPTATMTEKEISELAAAGESGMQTVAKTMRMLYGRT
jgi:hypothetical protein